MEMNPLLVTIVVVATAAAGAALASKFLRKEKTPEDATGPIEIGYWKIRGLAAPLRMMCAFKGVEFTDQRYAVIPKDEGGFDLSSWFGKKPDLQKRNGFMNLPYLIDGDVVITQSNACMAYLGRKLNLMGKNNSDLAKVEVSGAGFPRAQREGESGVTEPSA